MSLTPGSSEYSPSAAGSGKPSTGGSPVVPPETPVLHQVDRPQHLDIPAEIGLREYVQLQAEKLIAQRALQWSAPADLAADLREKLLDVNMPLISPANIAPLPVSVDGKIAGWSYGVFLDYTTGEHHTVLMYGDYNNGALGDGTDVPVRIHSSSKVSDIFFGRNSDSNIRLDAAISEISKRGRGLILYMEHDGRSNGVIAQAESLHRRFFFDEKGEIKERINPAAGRPLTVAESFQQLGSSGDARDYTVAAQILRALGVKSVELLGASENKRGAIMAQGIPVVGVSPHEREMVDPNPSEGLAQDTEVSLSGISSKASAGVRTAQRIAELTSHCRHIDADAFMPWEAVRTNKEILHGAGHKLVDRLAMAPAPTRFGDWTILYYGDRTTGEIHRALVYGDLHKNSLGDGNDVVVRLHSSCKTNEVFHSTNCECKAELRLAMSQIQREGRGIIVYLDQEGRGTGITGKLAQLREMYEFSGDQVVERTDSATGRPVQTVQAYLNAGYPAEIRDFSVGVEMLKDLGVRSIVLMTNNPRKAKIFDDHGIPYRTVPLIVPPHEVADPATVLRELRDKAAGLGHAIDEAALRNNGWHQGPAQK